jgi:hypothetical protein
MTTITAGQPRTDELLELARGYAADPARWADVARFHPERRWYSRLTTDGGAEAWLLSWLPGQGTELHDHGGASGAFVVVTGRLTEYTVRGGEEVGQRLPGGTARSFGPRHIHRIVNHDDVPAVSVHVYAPALSVMTRYRLDGGQLRTESIDRAGEDW